MSAGAAQPRRGPRLACSGTVKVVFSLEQPTLPAKILDLSAEGCLIETEQPSDLEQEDQVELAFTVNQLPFRVRARVRYAVSLYKFGFHFEKLSERSARRLRELVEELQEDARIRRTGGRAAGVELR